MNALRPKTRDILRRCFVAMGKLTADNIPLGGFEIHIPPGLWEDLIAESDQHVTGITSGVLGGVNARVDPDLRPDQIVLRYEVEA